MPSIRQMRSSLLLGIAGVCLAAGSVLAQSPYTGGPTESAYSGGPTESAYSGGPTESVIVTHPRLRIETTPLNTPPGRASLSVDVRYDDLNLLTGHGARALRWRVWEAANEVCDRLAEVYPFRELSTARPCLRSAYWDGMVRAYGVISDARISYRMTY